MYKFVILTAVTASLTACGDWLDQDIGRYEAMSCIELEYEVNRQQGVLAQAQTDGVVAIGTGVLIDEDLGDIDNELALVDEEGARARLAEINRIMAFNGC